MKRFALSMLMMLGIAFNTAQAAPIAYEGALTSGVTVYGDVPLNSYGNSAQWDFWSFFGTAGNVLTITLDRTSGSMDPGVALYSGIGGDTAGMILGGNPSDNLMTYLIFDDDSGSDVPEGPFRNSLISGYALTATGYYTIAAFDVLGTSTGPWQYGLTVTGFSGNNVPEPASVALLGLGLAGIGFMRRRKNS